MAFMTAGCTTVHIGILLLGCCDGLMAGAEESKVGLGVYQAEIDAIIRVNFVFTRALGVVVNVVVLDGFCISNESQITKAATKRELYFTLS